MTGRAAMLALLLAGGAAAQAPKSPDPHSPGYADIATPDELGSADVTMPGGLEHASATMPDEEKNPEFPPNLDAIIAAPPLDPGLDQQAPWLITADGTVIPRRRATRPPTPVFRAPLTDAFSSRTANSAIELTFGGQTSLGGTLGMRVTRLETMPTVVALTVGESFALDDLTVRAFDEEGELVARAPLRLEIEGPEGFVDMATFERGKSALPALARGIGRIWVTSLLPARQNEPFSIPVVLAVREPGSTGGRMSARIYENVPASP